MNLWQWLCPPGAVTARLHSRRSTCRVYPLERHTRSCTAYLSGIRSFVYRISICLQQLFPRNMVLSLGPFRITYSSWQVTHWKVIQILQWGKQCVPASFNFSLQQYYGSLMSSKIWVRRGDIKLYPLPWARASKSNCQHLLVTPQSVGGRVLVTWNQPQQEYLQHRNWQMLQVWVLPTPLPLESWMSNKHLPARDWIWISVNYHQNVDN